MVWWWWWLCRGVIVVVMQRCHSQKLKNRIFEKKKQEKTGDLRGKTGEKTGEM